MTELRNRSVLIVDDNEVDRLVAKSILKKIGIHAIHEAENGTIAAGKLSTSKEIGSFYDLVFVDWNMPSSGGLKLLQMVSQEPKFKKMKMIVMTGTSDTQVVQDAIEFGADDFIVKPLTFEIVREKLENHN